MLSLRYTFMYTCLWIMVPVFTVLPQSIVASLGKYQKESEINISGISATSISGVSFHPTSKTLYIVDDAVTEVYEISTTGDLLRTITLSGFDDTEGIAYQSGMYFFIAEEREANVVRAQLPQAGSGTVAWDDCSVLSIGDNWGNTGLEDVAYCASTNTAYAIKEVLPPRLYSITLDSNGDPVSFNENDPFNIENNTGDAAGLFALPDSTIIILSQEDNKLFGYNSTGSMLSELPLGMSKPEGVTIDLSDSTIYVVGEPRELFVFKKPNTGIKTSSLLTPQFDFFSIQQKKCYSSIILKYAIPYPTQVLLEIFTIKGIKVRTLVKEKKLKGDYTVTWDTRTCPAGGYILSFKAGGYAKAIQEVLLH